jgi:uncharacterized protein (TIGR03083 family)
VPIDYLSHMRAEFRRFAEVLAAAEPTRRVPTCPEWDAADLLWHLSGVTVFWATIVRDRLDHPGPAEIKPDRPSDYDDLQRLFADSSAALIDALESTAEDVSVWTWFDADRSVGFVLRRQAHEALIHRLDAELTTDSVTPFDADLATDGVLEVLEVMFSEIPDWASHEFDGGIGRVATTDTGAQWLVRTGNLSGTDPDTGKSYTDHPTLTVATDGEPTFELTATARDLDAWLWNRPTLAEVAMSGDYARFVEIIRDGIQ